MERIKKEFENFSRTLPLRAVLQVGCEQCSGSNLYYCKQFSGFNVVGGEYCKYYIIGTRPKNCYDILVGGEHEWCYEGVNPDHSYTSHFTVWCWSCRDALYSDNCHSCQSLFGCVGLRNAKYCILNKQYSEADYQQLSLMLASAMAKSKEWGEFFPMWCSPFGYNETIAQDYFPLSEDKAKKHNCRWERRDQQPPQEQTCIVPDHIGEVKDIITAEILSCTHCKRHFKIMPLELQLYHKLEIPIPQKCPDCRRKARFAQTGAFRLWQTVCSRCGETIESAVLPEEGLRLCCTPCYEKEVY